MKWGVSSAIKKMNTYTLLIQMAAPLQSWGADSKFDTRRTCKEPTKSGTIGLVAAALGIKRDEDDKIKDLASLRFGVRVDKEGTPLNDFHVMKAEDVKDPFISNRHYLQDAVFIAALESENEELLEKINDALKNPAFPIFLGRRSCPPAKKLALGIFHGTIEENFKTFPVSEQGASNVRVIIDTESGSTIRDMPISFNPANRKHGFRCFTEYMLPVCKNKVIDHDPMSQLTDL